MLCVVCTHGDKGINYVYFYSGLMYEYVCDNNLHRSSINDFGLELILVGNPFFIAAVSQNTQEK